MPPMVWLAVQVTVEVPVAKMAPLSVVLDSAYGLAELLLV